MPKLPAVSRLKDIHWQKFLSIFPALAFALVTMFAILLASQAWKTMHHNLHVLMHEEQNHITMAESLFHQELDRLSRELLTFTGTPGILNFFANPSDKAARQSLTAGLSNYIKYKADYDQARILDINGRELIWVQSKGRQTTIIPVQELENNVPEAFCEKGPAVTGPWPDSDFGHRADARPKWRDDTAIPPYISPGNPNF